MSFEIKTHDRSPLDPDTERDIRRAVAASWAEALKLFGQSVPAGQPGSPADLDFSGWLGPCDAATAHAIRTDYSRSFDEWLRTGVAAPVMRIGVSPVGGYFVEPGRARQIVSLVIKAASGAARSRMAAEPICPAWVLDGHDLEALYLMPPSQ